YRYAPFGELVISEAALENPYRFMGRRFDASVDAYDFRAREYAPVLGRFLQRDIVTAPNLYVFVKNNPLTATDPMGTERNPTPSLTGELPSFAEEAAGMSSYELHSRNWSTPEWVKAELKDVPELMQSRADLSSNEQLVLGWLQLHSEELLAAARKFHVPPSAIAGAIAWEALRPQKDPP